MANCRAFGARNDAALVALAVLLAASLLVAGADAGRWSHKHRGHSPGNSPPAPPGFDQPSDSPSPPGFGDGPAGRRGHKRRHHHRGHSPGNSPPAPPGFDQPGDSPSSPPLFGDGPVESPFTQDWSDGGFEAEGPVADAGPAVDPANGHPPSDNGVPPIA